MSIRHWIRSNRFTPMTLAYPALFLLSALAPGAWADVPALRAIGDIAVEQDVWQVGERQATLVIGEPDLGLSRVRLALQPAADARAAVELSAMPADPSDLAQGAAAMVSIARDTAGRRLTATLQRFDAEQAAWKEIGRTSLDFWPEGGGALQYAERDGLEPRSWHDRWLNLRVDAETDALTFWLEGRLIGRFDRPAGARGALALRLAPKDRVRAIEIESLAAMTRFVPIDLDPYVNSRMASPPPAARVTAEGVPFVLPRDAGGILDLRYAAWIEWQRDPASMIERFYDGAGSFPHDPRMPMLRIPAADYTAAHILAVADADEAAFSDIVTLRAGRYDNPTHGAVIQHDFSARVPRHGTVQPTAAGTPDEPLYYARIPMTHAFAQDILSLPNPGRGAESDDARRLRQGFIDIEVTKEVRLARRHPDPNRFRHRPLGLPSGVRLAAITFELSPLQMRVTSAETGHAFVEPQEPVFTVMLTNITNTERTARLTLEAIHLDGTHTSVERTASVPAGDTVTLEIPVPTQRRGYHTLAVLLADARDDAPLLRRETAFARLPPDRRQHRAQSPFGTWAFDGANYTPSDQDLLGPLYVKLGLRYGMFRADTDELVRYGVVPGNEPQVQGAAGPDRYEKFRAHCAAAGLEWPGALIFHEQSISGRHVTRVPDLFADRPDYRLSETEQKRFDELWEQAIAGATAMRERFPRAHLRLGNGPVPFKEELYRRGFPSELFDSAGNEAGSYGRPPETQPPDWVANNASLWMDRMLLDAYGYADKPVTQCYEITYPGTNPGNLDYATQADYMVRHALHSLAWEIPEIKLGLITDVGCSYYFSNWGSAGFCRAQPEMSVKPSFVSFAIFC